MLFEHMLWECYTCQMRRIADICKGTFCTLKIKISIWLAWYLQHKVYITGNSTHLKGPWHEKFALIFCHIRGLCTIQIFCKFHSLKCPPRYKQIINLIKLLKQLVLDLRGKVTSPRSSHLHKLCLQIKALMNSHLPTTGPAPLVFSRITAWHLITLNESVASRQK